jgi:FkbM family methyltransferase
MKNKLYKLSLYIYKLGLWPALQIVWKMFRGKKGERIAFQVPGILHPVFIRAQTSDEYTFQQIFINEEYGFEYKGSPKNIIDAGSNIGLAAIYFANRFPEAKIICLEPEESNFNLLVANTKPYPNIVPLQKGLWSKKTHLQVEVTGKDNWGFTVKECGEQVDGAIAATSIPDLIGEFNLPFIDIAKIDIEGSEREVLLHEDAQAWVAKCKFLVIELHDRMQPGTSEALFSLMQKLTPFRIDICGENLICEPLLKEGD